MLSQSDYYFLVTKCVSGSCTCSWDFDLFNSYKFFPVFILKYVSVQTSWGCNHKTMSNFVLVKNNVEFYKIVFHKIFSGLNEVARLKLYNPSPACLK